MEAPKTPKDSSTPKIRTTKRSGGKKADSGEEGDDQEVPSLVRLVPIGASPQQSPFPDEGEQDMRDLPMYSPSFNPDDLFAFPFPYVPPLSHEALDKRFRASRAQIQGDSYQALFRDLIRPSQSEADVPCGSCPCCQKMLSYVSSLRTVLDHMVSDIVQKSPAGTTVAPCVLCLQEHREHDSHQEHRQFELGQPHKKEKRNQQQRSDVPLVQNEARSHRHGDTSQAVKPTRLQSSTGHRESQQGPSRVSSEPTRIETVTNGLPTVDKSPQEHNSSREDGTRHVERAGSDQLQPHSTPEVSNFSHRLSAQVSHSSPQNIENLTSQQSQDSAVANETQRNTQDPLIFRENPPPLDQHPLRQASGREDNLTAKEGEENPTAPPRQDTRLEGEDNPTAPPRQDTRLEGEDNPTAPPRQDNQDRTWRDARAQLLEPPELSPRDNHSPVVSHGGQYIFPPSDPNRPKNEAYVTIASDNLTALCCLVLGNSLRLTNTTRSLAIIVTDGVSGLFRHLLQNVFDVVQTVGVMDSQGSTKLALLEQPELGVSFTKPYIWSLDQFTKCVFLESDTLVVQNCDELFEREELSAVPDIGWPDCFNSGVFVFAPSQDTFWKLIHFAEQQDSFDGGDQGLLNVFFRNWASDISRKLPFLYNLMANVSYTYKPAFKHFGSRVKIVHFFGSYKPWNVQFHPKTGQMAPGSNVHPTYAQFVHFWLEIYTKRVLPIFSQEIQDHMFSQEYACPHEVLQFIPSPVRQESLPTPPSFRVYSGDKPRDQPSIVDSILKLSYAGGNTDSNETEVELVAANEDEIRQLEEPEDPNTMPGADIDDFQNMAAWEQGRMDYMGQAKSDTIMKRLDFLIQGRR